MFVVALFTLALIQQQPTPTPVPDVSVAGQTQTDAERQAADEEARLNEVVCRREHVVGTNRPQRICQTRRQWENLRDQSLQDLNDRNRTVEDHLPTAGAGR